MSKKDNRCEACFKVGHTTYFNEDYTKLCDECSSELEIILQHWGKQKKSSKCNRCGKKAKCTTTDLFNTLGHSWDICDDCYDELVKVVFIWSENTNDRQR